MQELTSNRYETLYPKTNVGQIDGYIKPWKIGDVRITSRTDLSDNWLLCNGIIAQNSDYPLLSETSLKQSNPSNYWTRNTTMNLEYGYMVKKFDSYYYAMSVSRIYASTDKKSWTKILTYPSSSYDCIPFSFLTFQGKNYAILLRPTQRSSSPCVMGVSVLSNGTASDLTFSSNSFYGLRNYYTGGQIVANSSHIYYSGGYNGSGSYHWATSIEQLLSVLGTNNNCKYYTELSPFDCIGLTVENDNVYSYILTSSNALLHTVLLTPNNSYSEVALAYCATLNTRQAQGWGRWLFKDNTETIWIFYANGLYKLSNNKQTLTRIFEEDSAHFGQYSEGVRGDDGQLIFYNSWTNTDQYYLYYVYNGAAERATLSALGLKKGSVSVNIIDGVFYYTNDEDTSTYTYGYQSYAGTIIPTYTPADNLSAYIKVKEGE